MGGREDICTVAGFGKGQHVNVVRQVAPMDERHEEVVERPSLWCRRRRLVVQALF